MINVFINGERFSIKERSLNLSHRVNERSVASFIAVSDMTKKVNKRALIELYDDDILIFRGLADSIRDKNFPLKNKKIHQISCTDNHSFVDKRSYSKVWINTNASDIVRHIVDNVLYEEGITYDINSIQSGEAITKSFDYKYCNDVLDELADLCGFVWWIDNDKKLFFQDPRSVKNPRPITDVDIKDDSVEYEADLYGFRNVQIIKDAKGHTGTLQDRFFFDGLEFNITLKYPIYQLISITNEAGIPFNNISLKGEETDATTFAYSEGDNVISIESDNVNQQLIVINYIGQIPIIGISQNQRNIEDLKTIEGGSGKIENIVSEPDTKGNLATLQSANSKLERYGRLDQMSISFKTLIQGYDAGELVDINLQSEGVNEEFLIEEVNIYDEVNLLWYHIKAVRGNIYDSWAKVFTRALEREKVKQEKESILDETIVVAKSYYTEWSQTARPQLFAYYPPSPTLTLPFLPSFDYGRQIVYLDVTYINLNGMQEQIRVHRSNQYTIGNKLTTVFYINPGELNGQWTKLKFYGGNEKQARERFTNSGILIDEIDVNIIKNEYENIQINRTDERMW
jgi:hypothetical protein